MQQLAQGIASLGRGQDSMLVHMTPGEVRGLQGLARAHGGSLTINPQTGLPEAGFLSSILPMAIGMGANFLSGGTLSPLVMGLITGGATAAMSGSLEKGMLSGLTAGVGAYGAAGIGDELANAGVSAADTANVAANSASTAGATDALTNPSFFGPPADAAASAAAFDPMASASGAASAPNAYTGYGDAPQLSPEQLAQRMGVASPAQAAQIQQSPFAGGAERPIPMPSQESYEGLKGQMYNAAPTGFIGQAPRTWANMSAGAAQEGALGNAVMSKNGLMAGMGLLAPMASDVLNSGTNKGPAPYAPGASNYAPRTPYDKDYRPGAYNPNGENNFFPGDRYARGMAEGGIAALQTYKAGGLLDGPGDGVSDSIPAVIGGPKPQRAALADGEFVIPARAVSEIGNGSTKAGAKRLYSMLDRIEKARKKVKNGKDSGAYRMMPA